MILKSIATANRIVHWTFVLAALVAGGAAHAQVLFQTGFEPPAYTTGALNGQNGWAAPSNGTVESSTVLTGSQAVQFLSSGLSTQSLISQPITYSSIGTLATLVKVQLDFQVSTSGTQSNWDGIAVQGSTGFLGQVVDVSGNFGLGLASSIVGSIPVVRGVWHHLELDLDYSAQVLTAYIDGVLLGTGPFVHSSTTLSLLSLGVNSAPGSDLGYFDNVLVSAINPTATVPALSSWGLVGLALLLAVTGGWRLRCV
jgi:hypothetical protein